MTTQTKSDNRNPDIFTRSCIVQFNFSTWGGTKSIKRNIAQSRIRSKWAKASKNLVDPLTLKDIKSYRGKITSFLSRYTVPFPIDSCHVVSYEALEIIDDFFKQVQEELDPLIDKFEVEYDAYIKRAEAELGPANLFEPNDYPRNIRSKFGFAWQFITISPPGEESLLSPEMVERESARFKRTMENARQMGVQALTVEMKTMVERAVERLTPKDDGEIKTFHASTMKDNFLEFFETFKIRNIFKSTELEEIIEKAKGIVNGINMESLRWDDDFRESVKKEMETVGKMLDDCIQDAPGRKLKFRNAA